MDIQIQINLDNDAFSDGQARTEIRDILDTLAEKFRFYPLDGRAAPITILDSNGNSVGTAAVR